MGFSGLLELCGVWLPAAPAAPEPETFPVDGGTARIIRAPGRLVLNPDAGEVANGFPFGGTEVARVRGVMLQSLGVPLPIEYELLGDIGAVLEGEIRHVLACILRGWTDEAAQSLFGTQTEEGAETGHAVYSVPGDRLPGLSEWPRGVRLLFVPDDNLHAPAVMVYHAIPTLTADAQLSMDRKEELDMPIAFECCSDESGRIVQIGRLHDLDLTP